MIDDLVVTAVLNTTEYLSGLTEMTSSAKEAVVEIGNLFDSVSSPVLNLEAWNGSVEDMVGAMDKGVEEISSGYKDIADPVVNPEGVVGAAQEMATSMSEATGQIKADITTITPVVDEEMAAMQASITETAATMQMTFAGAAGQIASDLNDQITTAVQDALSKASSNLKSFGSALQGVGGPALIGGAIAAGGGIFESLNRQQQLIQLMGNTGASSDTANLIDQLAQKLSVSTGASYSGIVSGAQQALQLGIDPSQLASFLLPTSQLANFTKSDEGTVAQVVGQTSEKYNMNFTDTANELKAIMEQGNYNMQAMSTSFLAPMATAQQEGFSLQDFGLAFNAITRSGKSSAEAGDWMSNFLNAFVNPSVSQKNAAFGIGQVLGEPQLYKDLINPSSNKGGLAGIINDFESITTPANRAKLASAVYSAPTPELAKVFASASQSPGNAIGSILGGQIDPTIVRDVANSMQTGQYQTMQKNITAAAGKNGLGQDNKAYNSSDIGKTTEATNNFQNALQKLGTNLKPVIDQVTNFVNKISDFVSKHPKLVATLADFALKIGAVTLIGGGAVKFIGSFIGVLSSLLGFIVPIVTTIGEVVIGLGLFTALGPLIAGIITVVIIGAIVLLVTHLKEVGNFFGWIWNDVLMPFFGWLGNIGKSVWGGITDGLGKMKDAIGNTFNSVKDTVTNIVTNLLKGATQWGSDLIHNIANGIMAAAQFIENAAKSIADTITGFLHFSKPDEGPLAESDKWMPDMMELFASGITKGAPKMKQALNQALQGVGMYGSSILNSSLPLTSGGGSVQNSRVVNQTNNINVNGASNQWQMQQAIKNMFDPSSLNKLNYY